MLCFRKAQPILLGLAAVAVSFGQAAQAQEESSRIELFAQGGGSFHSRATRSNVFILPSPPFPPDNLVRLDTRHSHGTSGRLFVGMRFYPTPRNGVEASYALSLSRLQSTITATLIPSPPGFPELRAFGSEPMTTHTVSFNYVRVLPGGKRFSPFVTGGLGLVRYVVSFPTDESNRLAGNFGGGVDIRLNRRVAVRAEVRDYITERPDFSGFTTMMHIVAPTAGVVLKF
ncbi:MAG: outer membrane beta-barrel protein [Candidatus Acidiferrales bacterium]